MLIVKKSTANNIKLIAKAKRAAEFEVALFEIGKRAAELFDEILFKKPPSMEDCPICMLQLPLLSDTPNIYLPCCGQTLCDGCMDEMLMLITERERYNCPFCRTSMIDSEKFRVERCMKRMKADDADAFNMMGSCYLKGSDEGLRKDTEKALEMYLRAAELGLSDAHNNIAAIYYSGQLGVEIDREKYMYHWQQAAIKGCSVSRYNLGNLEAKAGNIGRAMKHWMISAGCGNEHALQRIRQGFMSGNATKAQFETALRDYQAYIDEVKSEKRDKAAARNPEHPNRHHLGFF